MKIFLSLVLCCGLLNSIHSQAAALTALEIIQKEEAQVLGNSFTAHATLVIDPDGNSRTMEYKMWAKERKKTLIKLIKPEKDKNVGNLKIDLQLWQFLPKVDRIIKIPPSMMLQSWMGSDFTNDDLVKSAVLSRDYTLKLLGTVEIDKAKAYKIEAIPKPDAPIVWGKIIEYVAQGNFSIVRREMYDEKGKEIKTMIGTQIKQYNGHYIPSIFTMINHENKDRKSVIHYIDVTFDQPIDESVFTQAQLRKPVF